MRTGELIKLVSIVKFLFLVTLVNVEAQTLNWGLEIQYLNQQRENGSIGINLVAQGPDRKKLLSDRGWGMAVGVATRIWGTRHFELKLSADLGMQYTEFEYFNREFNDATQKSFNAKASFLSTNLVIAPELWFNDWLAVNVGLHQMVSVNRDFEGRTAKSLFEECDDAQGHPNYFVGLLYGVKVKFFKKIGFSYEFTKFPGILYRHAEHNERCSDKYAQRLHSHQFGIHYYF